MAAELFTDLSRATDANSSPLSGAKWYFYATGTTTPQAVYTTAALATPHANPVVADSGGQFAPIYFDATLTYRGILKTSAGSTIQDLDPINTGVMGQLSASTGSSIVGFLQTGTGATARTAQDKLREVVSITDFGATTGATDNKTAIEAAVTSAMANGRSVYIPPGVFKFSQINLGTNSADVAQRLVISGPGTLRTTYSGYAITSTGVFNDLIIDGVRFLGVEGSGTKLFNGDNFLRLMLLPGCQFSNLDWVVHATGYLQSLRMIGCIVRIGTPGGAVVKAPMAYDCNISQNVMEYVWDGVVIDGPGVASNRCKIAENTIEGIGGRAIVLAGCLGTAVCDNYMEDNTGGDIYLNAGTDAHLGVRIQGNKIEFSASRQAQTRGSFTGSISGTTLTITAVAFGTLAVGTNINGSGITPGTIIGALGTGTGGVGTYILASAQTVASTTITSGAFGIVWGQSAQNAVRAGGNYCSGNLHDTTGTTGFIDMGGDVAGGELYTGYRVENVSSRAPLGRAFYFSDTVNYMAYNDRYVGLDPYRQEIRFGGKFDSTTGGTDEPPVISFGTASPSADPAQYERTKWAKGSVVFNANAASAAAGYWVCTVAGTPGTWSFNGAIA
jgi:hypothetical protein